MVNRLKTQMALLSKLTHMVSFNQLKWSIGITMLITFFINSNQQMQHSKL